MPIKTTYEFPPIPDRRFDWRAYHEGEEEANHCGWGRTKEEAIADLERLDEERDDSMEWCEQCHEDHSAGSRCGEGE